MFLETKREGEAQTIPQLESWRQILLRAADYMESHGKCRMVDERADGRVCTLGAISHGSMSVNYDFNDVIEAQRRFIGYIKPSRLSDRIGIITRWNDNPLALWRTKSWIVGRLRAAARS